MADAMFARWDFNFVVDGEFEYSFAETLCSWSMEQLSVLPALVHLSGGRVVSDACPMGLAVFLECLPEPMRRVADRRVVVAPGPAVGAQVALLAAHPWAMECLHEGRDLLRRRRLDHGHSSLDEQEEGDLEFNEVAVDEPIVLTAAALEEVDKALAKARDTAAADHLGAFRVFPLGEAWT